MSAMTMSELTKNDVWEAAALHRRAFPSFFLSELGEPFLREFYRAFLRPGAVTLVARGHDNEMIGVAVGHRSPEGFFRKLLLRRWWAFALASFPLLVRRPRVITRLLRALSYRGQPTLEAPGALLSSICVADRARGTGAGQLLLDGWTARLVALGGVHAYLTTDRDENDPVNSFYVRSGWSISATYETPEGRGMSLYTWQDGRD